MTDPISDTATAPAPSVSPADTAPVQSSPPKDDLASLLQEFDAASQQPTPKPEAKAQPEVSAPTAEASPLDTGAAWLDWRRAEQLDGQVKNLSSQLEGARRIFDQQDFEKAVSAAEKLLQDAQLPVPEGFVKNALVAASTQDPELRAAFDNRGSNPHLYGRLLKKANERIFESARSMPDPQATADRAAVVFAVRNSGKVLPAAPPPRYGDLSDAEFAAEKKKLGF